MALGRAFSVAVRGLDGEIVEIEADITSGLPGVHLVGLPDAALQESRDRVRAAITNCGNSWPMARLTLASRRRRCRRWARSTTLPWRRPCCRPRQEGVGAARKDRAAR